MSTANFRVIDNERVHPRDAARKAVKRFRANVEREGLGVCNQSTGARNLFVDEVIRRSEMIVPEPPVEGRYSLSRLLMLGISLLLIVGGLYGVYLLF